MSYSLWVILLYTQFFNSNQDFPKLHFSRYVLGMKINELIQILIQAFNQIKLNFEIFRSQETTKKSIVYRLFPFTTLLPKTEKHKDGQEDVWGWGRYVHGFSICPSVRDTIRASNHTCAQQHYTVIEHEENRALNFHISDD